MKYLSILMAIILLGSLFGAGYLLLSCDVTVTGTGVARVEASHDSQRFQALKMQVRDNAVDGIAFTSNEPGTADGYQLITYSIELSNTTFVDAECIELQVTPRESDVLQIGTDELPTLPARSSGIFEVTILTGIDASPSREIFVTYYLWGRPYSIRAVCNA